MKRRNFLQNSAFFGAAAVFCTANFGLSNLNAKQNTNLNSQNGAKMENYLFEIARKRRSIRTYGKKPIEKNILDEIMKIALCAPSSFGYRPVEFVLVQDKSMIRKIGQCKTLGGSQLDGADTVVVVMVKTQNERAAEFWIEDGAVASAYILLAAEQYEIGACWVQIRNRTG
ncbi:MAG: nitroreductase family protein, partial [Campylobacter sp.]|nr:nitroreductase family protein [Campylobacter sp.]